VNELADIRSRLEVAYKKEKKKNYEGQSHIQEIEIKQNVFNILP